MSVSRDYGLKSDVITRKETKAEKAKREKEETEIKRRMALANKKNKKK